MKERRRIWIKLTAVLLITACAMFIVSSPMDQTNKVLAQKPTDSNVKGYEDRINQLQKDQKEYDRLMKEAKANADSYLKEKEYLDKQIVNLNEQIVLMEELIAEYDAAIVVKENEIAENEAKYDEKFANFKDRLRVSYEDGSMGYLAMLFSSNSISEFLISLERMTNMLEFDKHTMKQLNDEKAALNEEKAELQRIKESNEAVKAELEANKQELDKLAREAENFYNEAQNQAEEYYKKYQQAQAAEKKETAALDAYLEELAKKNSGTFNGSFRWPLSDAHNYITSKFGSRTSYIYGRWVTDYHRGIDISCATGTPVYACAAGTVEIAQWNNSYGYYVVISHGSGLTTLYAHNSSLKVKVGQKVNAGDVISLSGSTGNSSGPHLHLEISDKGKLLDPLNCGKLSHPALTGYYK